MRWLYWRRLLCSQTAVFRSKPARSWRAMQSSRSNLPWRRNALNDVKHKTQSFGLSVVKIDIVEKYLEAYTAALKGQAFKLSYIDAFAGSGSFSFDDDTPPLFFDSAGARWEHEGSPRRRCSHRGRSTR
jgi:hypothetical protein